MAQPLRWPREEWNKIEAAMSDAVRQAAEQQISNVLVDAVDTWLTEHGYEPTGPLRDLAIIRAHQDLTDIAQHQIVHFAARARHTGVPWSGIGAALRYSHPEAAMGRWGEPVREEQERYQAKWDKAGNRPRPSGRPRR
jgi:hypothetical protein